FPYVQSFRLVPAEEEIDETADEKKFISLFENFVYERSLKERAGDIYSAEMKMSMFIPLSHYAYLMKKRGEPELSRKYYLDSLRLFTPKGLAHYVAYLKSTGRKGEALSFVEAIEPYAEKDPEVRKLSDEIRKQFL
ncbi:hypothetical protein GTO10_03175, partial [Candidatus Saccharibacteria bacterium]|nr:hypothetical protein [Candidatus Saccharibacteria bacterium]